MSRSLAVFLALAVVSGCAEQRPKPTAAGSASRGKAQRGAGLLGRSRAKALPTMEASNLVMQGAPAAALAEEGARGAEAMELFKRYALATVLVRTERGYGSGVLVEAPVPGLVVTNHHVVAGAKLQDLRAKVRVMVGKFAADGSVEPDKEYDAWVLRSDPEKDIAALQIVDPPDRLVRVAIPSSDRDPRVGQDVAAIGNGNVGLLWSMKGCAVNAVGTLSEHAARLRAFQCQNVAAVDSATARFCQENEKERHYLEKTQPARLVQTGCSLSGGDSGGPLLSLNGELLGLNVKVTKDRGGGPGAGNYHVHVSEVREFLKQGLPARPPAMLPDPWKGVASDAVLGDADLDGKFDVLMLPGEDTASLLFDLDQDSVKGTDAPKASDVAEKRAFDAEVQLFVSEKALFAWYDTDNDGTFDRILVKQEKTPLEAYRFQDGGWQRTPESDAGAPLRTSLIADEGLRGRLDKQARLVAQKMGETLSGDLVESTTDSAPQVPDPLRGGGREAQLKDFDGDGLPDSLVTTGVFSKGLQIDPEQASLGRADPASAQKLVAEGSSGARFAAVLQGTSAWVFYDPERNGKLALMLRSEESAGGMAGEAFWIEDGKIVRPAPEHAGRALLRPALLAKSDPERFAEIASQALDSWPLATDEGMGSFPALYDEDTEFEIGGKAPYDNALLFATGDQQRGVLIDLDRVGTRAPKNASAERALQELTAKTFKPSIALVDRAGASWVYYDTDRKGGFDVVLFTTDARLRSRAGRLPDRQGGQGRRRSRAGRRQALPAVPVRRQDDTRRPLQEVRRGQPQGPRGRGLTGLVEAPVAGWPDRLPPGWQVVWLAPSAPPPAQGLVVQRPPGQASTSMAVWREGAALGTLPQASEPALVALPAFAVFDDLWALYLCVCRAQGLALPEKWEAIARYAEAVRQGYWPDKGEPERALQSLYAAVAQHHLQREEPRRDAFLVDAFRLLRAVAECAAAGVAPTDAGLMDRIPGFETFESVLRSDRALYRGDRSRGRAFLARMPPEASPQGIEREVPLLVLRRPVSAQFKTWARRDALAPGGAGFPLLLVELEDGQVVLSADPASKLRLGWLAAPLSEAEAKARGGGPAAWYDGREFDHTLCASPKDGTRLRFDELLSLLRRHLRLRNGSPRRLRGWAWGALAGGAAVLALGLGVALLPGPASRGAIARTGDPLPREELVPVFAESRGMTHFAVVAGVCRSYPEASQLKAACADARAVRELLVSTFGYRPQDVLLLVDDGGPDFYGAPTATNLKKAIEETGRRIRDRDRSSFLFFYAGHGGHFDEAQEFGALQPAGYFDHPELPVAERGWVMTQLKEDVRNWIRARHTLIALDCCYSGFAGARGGPELRPEVMRLWKAEARAVLTAGARSQRSWEAPEWGNHGAFSAFLLRGLTPLAGRMEADVNGDGLVTDDELAGFLQSKVPEAVRRVKGAAQEPQYFRLDEDQTERGQFLFVPATVP
ncbi:MAG: trypsin-like peptidase domain-containing protein [Myxococcales bacterium]